MSNLDIRYDTSAVLAESLDKIASKLEDIEFESQELEYKLNSDKAINRALDRISLALGSEESGNVNEGPAGIAQALQLISDLDLSSSGNMPAPTGAYRNTFWNEVAPKIDTSGITDMSNMFNNCNGAAFNPNLSSWDVNAVTDMSNMFNNCSGVAFNPDFSGWNTSAVTSMNAMLTGIASVTQKKIWLPATFTMTKITVANNKLFNSSPGTQGVHVYTPVADATAADALGWDTANAHANWTFHWGATHQDFENASL